MATCNDCIHYETCVANESYITKSPYGSEECCMYFVDKSRFIKLPCKIGDMVYVVSQGRGFDMTYSVFRGVVTAIHIDNQNVMSIYVDANDNKHFGYFPKELIFAEKDKAEQKLKSLTCK